MKTLTLSVFIILLLVLTARAQITYKTVEGYPACILKSDIEKVVKYSSADDTVAFNGMLDGSRCSILKGGVQVQRMDSTWGGLVEIRPMGMEGTVWTFVEAIKE